AGCAKQAAPSPAPAPAAPAPKPAEQGKFIVIEPSIPAAPAPKPAVAPAKVYKYRFNDWGPSQIDIGLRAKEWAQVIEDRSGGRVHFDTFFAEALLKRADTYRGLEAGLADVSIYVLGSNPGIHQINRVIDLPGTGIPGQIAQQEIYQKLRDKYPEMLKEYGNAFPLIMRGLPAEHIHNTGKFHLVRVPADAAGLKTYANALWSDAFNTIGVAIVNPAVMDWYLSLDRNLIQGMFMHWLAIYSFGLTELMKYHTLIGESGIGMQSFGYIMNKDSFAELPADLQKIVLDTSTEWFNKYREDDPKTIQAGIDLAKKLGNQVVTLTPDEQQQWFDLAKPIHEKWIADSEKAGFANARAIYNDMLAMIKEYK
ncbi:MAG: TRAP transporter substrate-binding protein DctP, partial [Chloroflexota bacterium]